MSLDLGNFALGFTKDDDVSIVNLTTKLAALTAASIQIGSSSSSNLSILGDIVVAGLVDGVDIAALNTTVAGLGAPAWSTITGTPTTLTGYGITNSLATASTQGLCLVDSTGAAAGSLGCAAMEEEEEAARRYLVQHDANSKLSVCVPWVDTVYTHPTTEGNIHLPSHGRQGDYISWASAGTGQWRTFPVTISNAQAGAIASNTTGVATNVTNIANLTSAMSTDTERLAAVASLTTAFTNADATLDGALTASISTNATNIATNVTNIAANVSDITATENATATNATNIATNVTNIATNVTAIAANTSKAVQNEPLLLASGIGYVASPAANYYYVGNGVYGWSHHNWAGVRTGGRSTGGGTPSIEDGTTWASAKPAVGDQWAQVEDKTGNCGIIVPVDLTGLALKIQTRSTGGNDLMSFFLAKGPQTTTNTNNLMTIVAVGESSVTQGVWLVKDLTCTTDIADDQAIFIGFGNDTSSSSTTAIKMNFSLIGYKA